MLGIYLAIIDDKEDEISFREIYSKYSSLMYKIAFSYTGNHHLAEEALQISFIGIAKNITKIKTFDEQALEVYLCKTAKNSSFSLMRKEISQKGKTVSLEELHSEPESEDALNDEVAKKDLISKIRLYISSMEEQQRDIISLHFINNLTIKECARALSLPVSTVKTKLYRALREIKAMFKEEIQ